VARTEPKKGRPDLQGSLELDAHLMATAAKLFIEHGYEGTSMGQIVTAAGAGKQSLYRRYANKEALFKEVFTNLMMKNVMARCAEQMAMFGTETSLNAPNGLETLHLFARQSFNFMLERETVETFRLFVAERNRFPDLKTDIRNMIQGLEDEITRHIRRAQDSGFVRADLDRHISRSFMALFNEGPMVQALLELPSIEEESSRERYFDSAWKTFVDSVATGRQSTE
jgi:AcrR family transcriptional regulator